MLYSERNMRRTWVLLFVFIFGISSARAEFWNDRWRDFHSPVTTPAKWALISGTAATLLVVLTRHSIDRPFQSWMNREKPLGRWADVGDHYGRGYASAAYIGGMFLFSALAESENAERRALLMLRSMSYSVFMSTGMKAAFRQGRPGNAHERTSFPSGHSTMAFSFASVVAAEHEWYWGASAYALATLTAFSRLNDNRHFLRDVVAGATIGVSYGLGLWYRDQEKRSLSKLGRDKGWNHVATLAPTDDLNGFSFALSATF